MGYRRGIYFGEKQKAEIWDRWQRGESMNSIGRLVTDHGTDVNARDFFFEPTIHFAALRNRPAFAKLMRMSSAIAIRVEPISGKDALCAIIGTGKRLRDEDDAS